MKNDYFDTILSDSFGIPALKLIFEMYIEETVDDARVQRELEPVIKMIHEGKFDRQCRRA